MIELVVFFTGAVVMALEVLGTRVLNPSFGSGLYVWSALITVTLVSLALGYFLGGLAADRWPRRRAMFSILLLTAGLLLLIVLVATPVLRAAEDLGLRLGSLVGALTLFGLPLLFLGMVTPFSVRLRTRELARVGHVAGRLYALGTVGSVAGTLGTAFLIIPSLSHRSGLLLLAAVLGGLAGLGFLASGRGRIALAALALLAGGEALVFFGLPRARPSPGVLYDSEGLLGRLTVLDRTEHGYTERFFLIDGTCQTHLPPDPDGEVACEYIRTFELLTRWKPVADDVYMLGLGGGALVRLLRDYDLTFDVADIDPRALAVAQRYFHVGRGARLHVHAADGRCLLRRLGKRYDYIVIDMLTIDALPVHLYSREAFAEARDHLKPGGILAFNTALTLDHDGELASRSVNRTLASVFPHIRCYRAHAEEMDGHRTENRIFFASMAPFEGDPDPDPMATRRVRLAADGGLLLTDDYNPLDVLLTSTSHVYRRWFRQTFPEATRPRL